MHCNCIARAAGDYNTSSGHTFILIFSRNTRDDWWSNLREIHIREASALYYLVLIRMFLRCNDRRLKMIQIFLTYNIVIIYKLCAGKSAVSHKLKGRWRNNDEKFINFVFFFFYLDTSPCNRVTPLNKYNLCKSAPRFRRKQKPTT